MDVAGCRCIFGLQAAPPTICDPLDLVAVAGLTAGLCVCDGGKLIRNGKTWLGKHGFCLSVFWCVTVERVMVAHVRVHWPC